PTRIREIAQWTRYFFKTEPLIYQGVSLNAEFPITGFRNLCADKKIQDYFDELAFDVVNLPKLLQFVSLEYNKLGNAYVNGKWDEGEGRWSGFQCLNPDYVEVEATPFADRPILSLDPDDGLRRIIKEKSPRELYDQLDPTIIEYVSKGKKVPLSDIQIEIQSGHQLADGTETIEKKDLTFPQVWHLANKNSPYEAYGTSPIYACLKALIYKDLIRQTQFSIARRHWKPIKVIKVGDDKNRANAATFKSVQQKLMEASSTNEGWFIWHNYLTIDYVGSAGHLVPMDRELDWVNNEIYAALGINKSMIMGESVNYASANVGLQILINRYIRFQQMLSEFIKEYIYKPVAKVQEFYKTNDSGKQELIIPDIEWGMMRMRDDVQQKTLLQALQGKGLISKRTLLTYVDIDFDREKELIAKEKKEEREQKLKEKFEDKKTSTSLSTPKEKGGAEPEFGLDLGGGEEAGGKAPAAGGPAAEAPTPPAAEAPAGGGAAPLELNI
ncbi:MAG: hypothetical protein PHS33_09000, partial [Candidatus Omnitrophica bacterium]|nr:hypothetical protein [Candidatus Omnitrophota bacterium]